MTPHETITSSSNPRIRHAASLRAADGRRASGLTLVDGRRELGRAVAAAAAIEEIFVAVDHPAVLDEAWIAEAVARGARLTAVGPKAFGRVAFGDRDEGVVGVVRFSVPDLAVVAFPADRPLFIVEAVEKPGNLGAILRTADAAGLGGVILCDGRTDAANPAVIRASLGTAFTVPLASATVAETIAWCRRHARQVIAATPDGTRLWHEPRLCGATALLLGSEAHGLSPAWQAAATDATLDLVTVRLPMRGIADSLNVSVTAAVLAYEAVRQGEQRS